MGRRESLGFPAEKGTPKNETCDSLLFTMNIGMLTSVNAFNTQTALKQLLPFQVLKAMTSDKEVITLKKSFFQTK